MSAHKSIDKICIIILALSIALGTAFCFGGALGIETKASAAGYENRLFDHSKVHTIDIVMNDWDGFIEGCESEEYSACDLVIDGEAVKNVGIRAKGNTSLSSVKNMDSDRYSFKIEFDQFENGKSYYGLDKLCLNNVIQDNTYMKDYLAYTLMNDFGVDTPLCSYAYITVNGEDWGLYLAVEAIENSFLDRNYGSNYGNLYKPDSMSFGGGRGNGRDFSMSDFMNENSDDDDDEDDDESDEDSDKDTAENKGGMPDMSEGFDPSQMFGDGNMPDFGGEMPTMPDGFDPSQIFGGNTDSTEAGESSDGKPSGKGGFGGFGGFGMGSDDVKLKYIDDDIDSYSNIFNNMKTNSDTAAKKRLINSLKSLSEQTDLENVLDTEEVIRYFVVHNFLCNGDSYTGQMIHNYYLYEENGQMHMIPWDYNLAYGSFQGGSASSSVNSPIDTPVSGGMSDRPMVSWIFDNEEYTQQYHQLFIEFLSSVDLHALITETAELIDEYVEKDPTKFCTYDEFKKGVEAIDSFCTLRAQSVEGQLDGTIPSTSDGQSADSSALIDTGDLNTSDMGSMGSGGGGFGGGPGGGGNPFGKSKDSDNNAEPEAVPETAASETAETVTTGSFKKMSQFIDTTEESGTLSAAAIDSKKPSGGFGGGERPSFGDGNMPDDFDPSQFDGEMPDGFDPSQFGDGEMPDFGGEKPSGFGDKKPEDADADSAPTEEAAENIGTESDEKVTLKINDTPSEDKTAETTVSSSGSDEKSKGSPDKSKGDSKGSRPSMGGGSSFPGGMGGTMQADNTTAYILLGISTGVLLIGIIIAGIYKRRK